MCQIMFIFMIGCSYFNMLLLFRCTLAHYIVFGSSSGSQSNGVPQGILDPLLSITFINDIPLYIDSLGHVCRWLNTICYWKNNRSGTQAIAVI